MEQSSTRQVLTDHQHRCWSREERRQRRRTSWLRAAASGSFLPGAGDFEFGLPSGPAGTGQPLPDVANGVSDEWRTGPAYAAGWWTVEVRREFMKHLVRHPEAYARPSNLSGLFSPRGSWDGFHSSQLWRIRRTRKTYRNGEVGGVRGGAGCLPGRHGLQDFPAPAISSFWGSGFRWWFASMGWRTIRRTW